MPSKPELARLRARIWNDHHRGKNKRKCACGRMVAPLRGVWPAPHLTFENQPCMEPVVKLPEDSGLEKKADDEG